MTLMNLAPVLAPTLFYSKNERTDVQINTGAIDILNDLIASFTWLFDVTRQEQEKERQIQQALVLLRESKVSFFLIYNVDFENGSFLQVMSKPAGDILVGVYVHDRNWGQCINVRLTPTMTAHELVQYVIRVGKVEKAAHELSVFEVVCNQQLERVIHWSDLVLGVPLSWASNWPAEDAKQNFLLIKENRELFSKLLPFFTQHPSSNGFNATSASILRTSAIPFSLFSELKFSGIEWGKTFKKVIFEFTGAKLNVYKDLKSSKILGEWNIESITWYMGAEKKRSPPNGHAITFFDRDKKIDRKKETAHFVGRVFCCSQEEEYYKWSVDCLLICCY